MNHPISIRSEEYVIRSYEADLTGHASIETISNLLQNVGMNHAMEFQSWLKIQPDPDTAFVLTRQHVRMERYPRWKETIRINTWLSPIGDTYAIRDFEILDGDGSIIGTGTNSAVFYSLKERRIVTVPDYFHSIPSPDRPRALDDPFERLPRPERIDYSRRFTARLSDIDTYRHVNNVVYVEWAMETLPAELRDSHILREIEINFRSQVNQGQTVLSVAQEITGGTGRVYLHRLSMDDGAEVALLRSTWNGKP